MKKTSSRPASKVFQNHRTERGAGEKSPAPRSRAQASSSPLDILLPYQRRYHDDHARWKAWLKSRQIGGSLTSTAEPTVDCFRAEQSDQVCTWLFFSAGERQAIELLLKAKQWTEAFGFAIADITEERDHSEALLKATTIEFPGGSRIISLPANANTARGYSGHVLFDEFAFLEDSDAMWRATFPIVSNRLAGEKKLRVISTANGKDNRFYQIITDEKQSRHFSIHTTTIHDAKAQGLDVDIDELRDVFGDPEGWAQEFECEFIDSSAILLPYDLIAQNESTEASLLQPPEYWQSRGAFPVDMGIDFGRKRNLTVAWSAEAIADLQVTKEVLCLRNMPTPQQVEILNPRIRKARHVCLDYTGPGVGLGDYLVQEHGEWKPEEHKYGKVELCVMSNPLKVDVFSKLRMAFESRSCRIPISRDVREDLHSMHRVTTASGNITYRAPLTEDGHADRCTALALCRRAHSYGGLMVGRFVPPRPASRRARAIAERKLREIHG